MLGSKKSKTPMSSSQPSSNSSKKKSLTQSSLFSYFGSKPTPPSQPSPSQSRSINSTPTASKTPSVEESSESKTPKTPTQFPSQSRYKSPVPTTSSATILSPPISNVGILITESDETLAERKNANENGLTRMASSSTKDVDPLLRDDEDEDVGLSKRRHLKKRVRYVESDDEADEEEPLAPSKSKASKTKKLKSGYEDDDFVVDDDEDLDEDYDMEDAVSENELQEELPKIKKSKTSQNSLAKFKNQVTATPKSISNTKAFRELPSPSVSSIVTAEDRKRERTKQFNEANDKTYSWLADVRDADGKRPSEPGYDPRTLYIPESAFKKFTAFERQFWEIKCKYFDTVVFFKKGKFYELYERDADIAHREFDLRVSGRAAMRMAGVPEASFESWASRFIAKGYKIAKVDQIETAVGKSMRAKAGGKKEDKVIRRELTRVLTAGTLIDESFITNDMSTYCLSIKEQVDRDALPPTFGVVFVDTSTAEFHFTSFEDDLDRTRLETLLVQVKPKEVVYEKGGLSQRTTRLLKNTLSTPIFNALTPEKEFWDHQRTLDELDVAGYFDGSNSGDDEEMADSTSSTERFQKWPEVIREARDDAPLMSAFGGLVWYLRTLKLDTSLLSLKNFHIYNPIQHATSLILDGQTLTNLEIFRNNSDGSTDGTLLQLLNKCTSPFGKRLFKKWMCHPLRNVDKINERLDAIEDFASVRGVKNDLEANLKQLPDLERMIGRINMGNCKLKEFLGALKAFEQSLEYIDQVKPYLSEFKSKRLIYLIENYPDIQPILDFFKDAFDHRAAAEHGEVIPKKGVEKDYDEILEVIESLELKFNEHLREVKKTLKVTNINYKDIGKDLRQLEVSSSVSVPSNFRKMSGTKTLSRYHTPTIIDLNREMAEALEIKNNILASLKKRMYKRFDSYFETWKSAVDCLAELDCLVGLANGREVLECSGPVCRPHFVSQKGENSKAVLELEELRHPCVNLGFSRDFIPNDTALGGADHPNMILLTGPNMGGKSTLLRQTCVAIIMAQLGCFLPASKCYLTPFDRIFTRIGANDNILAGQSTFMVELSETSKILKEATNRSLVILDELGRGTSTFDGYAIAYAVLHHLLVHVGCLGLFSTHYGMLTKEFDKTPLCGNYHMACHVDEAEKQVTFLYKLTKGACPKSYGMNVANMAGVPRTIIDRAEEVAGQFEKSRKLRDLAVQMVTNGSVPTAHLADLSFLMKLVTQVDGGEKGSIKSVKAIWKSLRGKYIS